MTIVQWFMNAIRGVYTPAIGMYDTSIGLERGTSITSPVNGVVIGNGYGGFYGAYGRQDWGGELDILTNLKGYGDKVVVDILHFDTIDPGIVPGTIVTAGQYLGTSGGQTSGGNWPSLPKYSTGPHIGVGVRSPYGFTPAYDAAPLIYGLRAGTVESSVPQGYGGTPSSGTGSGNDGGSIISSGLIGGLLPWLKTQAEGNWAQIIAGIERDLVGYSIRAGFVVFGMLLLLVGVILFFAAHPEEAQEAQEIPIPSAPSPSSPPGGERSGSAEAGAESSGSAEAGEVAALA